MSQTSAYVILLLFTAGAVCYFVMKPKVPPKEEEKVNVGIATVTAILKNSGYNITFRWKGWVSRYGDYMICAYAKEVAPERMKGKWIRDIDGVYWDRDSIAKYTVEVEDYYE